MELGWYHWCGTQCTTRFQLGTRIPNVYQYLNVLKAFTRDDDISLSRRVCNALLRFISLEISNTSVFYASSPEDTKASIPQTRLCAIPSIRPCPVNAQVGRKFTISYEHILPIMHTIVYYVFFTADRATPAISAALEA